MSDFAPTPTPVADRTLTLVREFDAPVQKVWQAWTDPKIVKEWFVPRPWSIASAEMDVRPGGASNIVMRDPEGAEHPNPGVYLEVIPDKSLVFTDAFAVGWVPAGKPFMVGRIEFEDLGGGRTRTTSTVQHWTVEDREMHEKMGFATGWGTAADQLAEVLAKG